MAAKQKARKRNTIFSPKNIKHRSPHHLQPSCHLCTFIKIKTRTLEDLSTAIKNKTFISTDDGFRYQLIPENTLRVYGDISRSAQYTITERDGKFILDQIIFGSEPLTIEIISDESGCMELTLDTQFPGKLMGTWIEEQEFL